MIDLVHIRQKQERELLGILAVACTPPEHPEVDVWGERNIVLSPKVTNRALAGPLKLDRRPYLRGPMRAFTEARYKHLLMIFSPQLGKTLIMQVILGYIIDQDPGPAMMAYPGQIMAKKRSKNHVKQLILDSPALMKHTTGWADDLQLYDYAFDNMRVTFAWAGSTTLLAGESIRFLFRDEADKWKHMDKAEAHPLDLVAERISSFDQFGRIIDATTLTTEDGFGWKLLNKSTFHECWVPCPHCGKPEQVDDIPLLVVEPVRHAGDVTRELTAREQELIHAGAWDLKKQDTDAPGLNYLRARLVNAGYQVLRWRGITGFTGIRDPMEVERHAHYKCMCCEQPIEHRHVLEMTKHGKWVPRFPDRDIAGFWCPTWYRAVTISSFGSVARRWVEAQGDKEKLQRSITQDLNEPWQELGVQQTEDDITVHCRGYDPDTIPFEPVFVFLTVDLRDPEIHYVIRAWGEHETSARVRYGLLPRLQKFNAGDEATGRTIEIIDRIRMLTFRGPKGHTYGINLTGIDSGDDTDEVYAYCRTRPGCVAMKSEDMKQILTYSRPEKLPGATEARPDSAYLIGWQHEYFADTLVSKMRITPGPEQSLAPGEWALPREAGEDYTQHMIAERKVEHKTRWGKTIKRWKQYSHKNHWLDCERMQVALARFSMVGDHKPEEDEENTPAPSGGAVMGRDFSDLAKRLR